ncbi:MAG: hypothetical protein DDT36_01687 [Firmicutes bacterium]|nr:hypothetical protein [Bacillota bacterium]
MKKLIKWEFRAYRIDALLGFLVILVVVGVAAWMSYALLNAPAQLAVGVFRTLLWGFLGSAFMIKYIPYVTLRIAGTEADANTLPLHVPLPHRRTLFAKLLATLPLLAAYIALNALMFHALPPDLPQLAELNPQRATFRATFYILGVALLINALVMRTLLRGAVALPKGLRVLERLPKWHAGLNFAADYALLVCYSLLGGILIGFIGVVGLPDPLQAVISATSGIALTYANGYLLEHYTPQLEFL